MAFKALHRNKVMVKCRLYRRKLLALLGICITIYAFYWKDNESIIEITKEKLNLRMSTTLGQSDENLQQIYRKKLEAELLELSLQNQQRPMNLKIIILSTWRSGSTFLNDILSSIPGSFNNFEPLCFLGTKVFRSKFEIESIKALRFFTGVLNCRYDSSSFFEHFNGTQLIEQKYQTLSKICNKEEYKSVCYQKSFMEDACSLFPINVIKTVRLGLSLVEPFLEETQHLHVIFLVRDPRAIMASRMSDKVVFCETPDCNDPSILCMQMNDDYDEYLKLSKMYPGRMHFIKYENLATSPLKVLETLMEKMNLSMTNNVKEFITNHTSKELDNEFSTYKIPSKHVSTWQGLLDEHNLNYIQSACSSFLKRMAYKIYNASELAAKPFNYAALIGELNRKLDLSFKSNETLSKI